MKGASNLVNCDIKDPANLSDTAGLNGASLKTGVGQLFRVRATLDTTGVTSGSNLLSFFTLPTSSFVLMHMHLHLLNDFQTTGGVGTVNFTLGIHLIGNIISATASSALSGGNYSASGAHKTYWNMSSDKGSLIDGTFPGGLANTDWFGDGTVFGAVGNTILGQPLQISVNSIGGSFTVTQGQFRVQMIGAFLP